MVWIELSEEGYHPRLEGRQGVEVEGEEKEERKRQSSTCSPLKLKRSSQKAHVAFLCTFRVHKYLKKSAESYTT